VKRVSSVAHTSADDCTHAVFRVLLLQVATEEGPDSPMGVRGGHLHVEAKLEPHGLSPAYLSLWP